jgi:hypothetical protein
MGSKQKMIVVIGSSHCLTGSATFGIVSLRVSCRSASARADRPITLRPSSRRWPMPVGNDDLVPGFQPERRARRSANATLSYRGESR